MGIGFRIKEAREHLGLTQTELGRLVGVTGSAITNYEKETSHPKEPVIYRLMDALDVDANYLFQDMVRIRTNNTVSLSEYEYLEKYRELDDYGKETIRLLIDREHARSHQPEAAVPTPMSALYGLGRSQSAPSKEIFINAAHTDPSAAPEAQAHDEQIMDDENF